MLVDKEAAGHKAPPYAVFGYRLLLKYRLLYKILNVIQAAFNECIDGHLALVAVLSGTDSEHTLVHFVVADDEHIGNLVKLGFTDLTADGFVSVINLNTQTGTFHLLLQIVAVVDVFVADATA